MLTDAIIESSITTTALVRTPARVANAKPTSAAQNPAQMNRPKDVVYIHSLKLFELVVDSSSRYEVASWK